MVVRSSATNNKLASLCHRLRLVSLCSGERVDSLHTLYCCNRACRARDMRAQRDQLLMMIQLLIVILCEPLSVGLLLSLLQPVPVPPAAKFDTFDWNLRLLRFLCKVGALYNWNLKLIRFLCMLQALHCQCHCHVTVMSLSMSLSNVSPLSNWNLRLLRFLCKLCYVAIVGILGC
jgi:hypothetical protein